MIIGEKSRNRKFYKENADITVAEMDANGDVNVPADVYKDIEDYGDISEIINDHGKYITVKPLIHQIEKLRQDVEDLQLFIVAILGTDSDKVDLGKKLIGYNGSVTVSTGKGTVNLNYVNGLLDSIK